MRQQGKVNPAKLPELSEKVYNSLYHFRSIYRQVTILEDKAYYESSEGGVTFSGGEPCLFMDYMHEVVVDLKKHNIHITIETSGFFNPDEFMQKLFPWIDLIYFDIKIIDEDLHKKYTGVSNQLILKNFAQLLKLKIPLLPRIPLVPGITATEENITNIALYFKSMKIKECVFLPYNSAGISKWQALGKEIPQAVTDKPLSATEEQYWSNYFMHIAAFGCNPGYYS